MDWMQISTPLSCVQGASSISARDDEVIPFGGRPYYSPLLEYLRQHHLSENICPSVWILPSDSGWPNSEIASTCPILVNNLPYSSAPCSWLYEPCVSLATSLDQLLVFQPSRIRKQADRQALDNMLASRVTKPKLSLSTSTAGPTQSTRPTLSLKPPKASSRSPVSPSPLSPTARNTRLNQRGSTTVQRPSYSYVNNSSSRSILKRNPKPSNAKQRQLSFSDTPVVHCVTPIDAENYYGTPTKTPKNERRWAQ